MLSKEIQMKGEVKRRAGDSRAREKSRELTSMLAAYLDLISGVYLSP